jgi:UDP-glucose:(heptosyl)LPS alpha-1,3-glucosyltransferase
MKLTIACKYFSPRGGAQTFLLNFVRCLLADGHRVKVVTMQAEGEMEGVQTRVLSLPPVPKTLRDVLFARATRRLLSRDDCDLSLGEQKTWGADVVRPGGGVHLEYIRQIVRSYPSAPMRAIRSLTKRLSPKERLNLYIERRLYADPRLRLVIANSPLVRRHLLRHYPALEGRIAVVYNGTDCARFSPDLRRHRQQARAELALPQDALVGAFVSYDLRRKGLPTVLRALSILRRKGARPVYALVVGRRKAWAARLARTLGVEDRVRLVGPQEPDRFYGGSDLLLLPSYFDPCANVTLEALACGLPVITSVQNGAFEMLTPALDGFYVSDPADAAQFAGFIEHFMDPERLRRASEAARALALKHTLEHQYREIMNALAPIADQEAAQSSRKHGANLP